MSSILDRLPVARVLLAQIVMGPLNGQKNNVTMISTAIGFMIMVVMIRTGDSAQTSTLTNTRDRRERVPVQKLN